MALLLTPGLEFSFVLLKNEWETNRFYIIIAKVHVPLTTFELSPESLKYLRMT